MYNFNYVFIEQLIEFFRKCLRFLKPPEPEQHKAGVFQKHIDVKPSKQKQFPQHLDWKK